MENFVYQNPVKICFGENVVEKGLGKAVKNFGKKALFIYGMNSIKKSGLYDTVVEQLKAQNIEIVEHAGVQANPTLKHAKAGIKKAIDKKVDVIVAVGGGSVIDEAKAIGIGAKGVDIWDYLCGKVPAKACLPIITILTMPATASEMNGGFVITNEKTQEKFGAYGIQDSYPKVSFLNPKYTLTIPLNQTAYAASDMIAHLLESYISTQKDVCVIDNYVEGMLKSVMESVLRIVKNPTDLDARANFMWAGSLAWNGTGVLAYKNNVMAGHAIEHPISGVYNIAHGAGLSMVIPAWLEYFSATYSKRILKFGKNVLGVKSKNPSDVVDALLDFYCAIGTPISWKQAGIKKPNYKFLAKEARKLLTMWGEKSGLYEEFDLEKIYKLIK